MKRGIILATMLLIAAGLYAQKRQNWDATNPPLHGNVASVEIVTFEVENQGQNGAQPVGRMQRIHRYEFNERGDVVRYSYNDGESTVEDKYYRYNSNGREVESIAYSDGKLTRRHIYCYDENGKIIEEHIYQFNFAGNHIEMLFCDEQNRYTKIKKYQYDNYGRKISASHYNASYSLHMITRYEYDPRGNLVQEITSEVEGNVYTKNSRAYDDCNRLIQEDYYVMPNYYETYKYDSDGKMVKNSGSYGGQIWEYFYDYRGLQSWSIEEDMDDKTRERHVYKFDHHGNVSKELVYDDIKNRLVRTVEYRIIYR